MSSDLDSFVYSGLRQRMVAQQLRARGIRDERVLAAMARVPRHEFTLPAYRDQAYEDHPLSIGQGQTISQPYIVALMLEALAIRSEDRALEVGTGSGYVTALLAELCAEVVSIERHAALADRATAVLMKLGYANVKIIAGDGSQGFPPSAPYDVILVSAAAEGVPPALLRQLGEDGRMILPVGSGESQQLQLIRLHSGQIESQWRELCRFVPLVSGEGLGS